MKTDSTKVGKIARFSQKGLVRSVDLIGSGCSFYRVDIAKDGDGGSSDFIEYGCLYTVLHASGDGSDILVLQEGRRPLLVHWSNKSLCERRGLMVDVVLGVDVVERVEPYLSGEG